MGREPPGIARARQETAHIAAQVIKAGRQVRRLQRKTRHVPHLPKIKPKLEADFCIIVSV